MKQKRDMLRERIINAIFIVLCLLVLGTFLLVLGSSFTSQDTINKFGYNIVPRTFSIEAYRSVFADKERVISAYRITFIVTVLSTALGLFFTSMLGYVTSRKDYPYRNMVSFYCFFAMLFNGGLVPTYILVANWLHLKNTMWAMILPAGVNIWNMLLMKGFFSAMPTSLIEAAKIDGLGEFRIFLRIIVPLSKPAFATVGLFFILGSWNQWFGSMLYTDDPKLVTLQYMLMKVMKNAEFMGSDLAMQTGALQAGQTVPADNLKMAMCIVAAGPILVVFPFFQKYFTRGITVGAVKG